MAVTEEQLTVQWVQAISTNAPDKYAAELLRSIADTGENAADFDVVAKFLANTPLAAEVLASNQSWELLDTLCVLSERVNADSLMKLAGAAFVHVRPKELVLMACERLHGQKDVRIFALAAYVLQIAIGKGVSSADLLSSLHLVKTTAAELIKKPQRREVVAAMQSFLLGVAQGFSAWVAATAPDLCSATTHSASDKIKGAEPAVYLMGVALALLHELLSVEPDESVVAALGSFVLRLGEALGIDALQLVGQPHRVRDMLCYVDRPRRASHEGGDENAVVVVTDSERDTLRACIESHSIRPVSLADCISWKHVTTFSFATLAAASRVEDEDGGDGDLARVRGMERQWIPARHLAEVLSCTPPLEWDLHGAAVCAFLALKTEAWSTIASAAWFWHTFLPHAILLLHTSSLVAVRMGQSILEAIISRQSFASYPAGGFLVYANLEHEYDDAAVVQKLKESGVERGVGDAGFSDALVLCHSTDSLGLLQLIINALTHDPSEESRQEMYRVMDKLFCLFEPQSRLRLLKRLIEDCPYHNVVGLLIDRAQREIQKLWSLTGRLPDEVFTEGYTMKRVRSTLQALSSAAFDDIANEMDAHTAVLALLRFLLLKDTNKQTYVHKAETAAQLRTDIAQALQRVQSAIASAEEKAGGSKRPPQLGGVPVFKFYLLQESLEYLRSLLG